MYESMIYLACITYFKKPKNMSCLLRCMLFKLLFFPMQTCIICSIFSILDKLCIPISKEILAQFKIN
jgi:hypothetical protein